MSDFFISPAELRAIIATSESPIVFDVSRADVYRTFETLLPTARWRDHRRAADWAREIPVSARVVLTCRHGHNVSQLAASTLRARGIDARALAGGREAWIAAGYPTVRKAALPARDEAAPSRWVTRIRPKIDRIACPWLIRRFIDREAQFLFVEPEHVIAVAEEIGGIPYDIHGVEITHATADDGAELCSFDTLIRRFGIADPALDALAAVVRGADTARPDLAPEAAGLLAVSLGISALSGGDDHAALDRGFAVYDALYAWQRHAAHETHNWPASRPVSAARASA